MRSLKKRRLELVMQTFAAINVRWRRLITGGSPVDGSLSARGVSSAGGSTVVCIFGSVPKNCNGTSRFVLEGSACAAASVPGAQSSAGL